MAYLGVSFRVFRRCPGVLGGVRCLKGHFVSDTAQVELKNGRV